MILKNLIKTLSILDFNKNDNCIEKSLKYEAILHEFFAIF
ncbi:hypothetical protein JJD26997_1533 [Campylobacter jejuni subsp. doylei 269.97]|uniref:Uncharacterized protein n=1 Tax=Campylobacter jejuni subsp. doylei (strain ATCC BAA-1458 / RM4099 / 269.97) TaxID=360109 RepID=A7H4W0_CAMJD|nr:hypothetical protein JJD26997_1533 [Campylobacter jejuni subsp. doylei 269.97]